MLPVGLVEGLGRADVERVVPDSSETVREDADLVGVQGPGERQLPL